VVESVYSAVRTDSLYKANYASSLKGQTETMTDWPLSGSPQTQTWPSAMSVP